MGIKCCKDCVAPKRHLGCHDTCEEYKKEKAQLNAENEQIRREKERLSSISLFEYNKIACTCKSRRERKRRK